MNKKIKYLIFTVLIILLVCFIFNQRIIIKELKDLNISTNNKVGYLEQNNQDCLGAIEGALMYPSEKIPDGMYICARNVNTKYEYCTDQSFENPKFKYKKGYKLEVPSGEYIASGIYPMGIGASPIEKAVEFKHTTCSEDPKCSNSPLLAFKVECGKTTENINLFDGWRIDFFRRFFSLDEQKKLTELEKNK